MIRFRVTCWKFKSGMRTIDTLCIHLKHTAQQRKSAKKTHRNLLKSRIVCAMRCACMCLRLLQRIFFDVKLKIERDRAEQSREKSAFNHILNTPFERSTHIHTKVPSWFIIRFSASTCSLFVISAFNQNHFRLIHLIIIGEYLLVFRFGIVVRLIHRTSGIRAFSNLLSHQFDYTVSILFPPVIVLNN